VFVLLEFKFGTSLASGALSLRSCTSLLILVRTNHRIPRTRCKTSLATKRGQFADVEAAFQSVFAY